MFFARKPLPFPGWEVYNKSQTAPQGRDRKEER